MKWLRWGLVFLVLFFIGVVATTPKVPSFSRIKNSYQSSDLQLTDYEGKFLFQWRQDKKKRSLAWRSLSDISPILVNALLKSEDKNFFKHRGVDFTAIAASFYQRILKSSPRGGSTISMQVGKLIAGEDRSYNGWLGKLRQFYSAFILENSWSKQEILETYFNLLPFRGEDVGVASATWNLFGKSTDSVTLSEATLLSVLIRSPNASTSEWITRACRQEPSLCENMSELVQRVSQGKFKEDPALTALHVAQRLSRGNKTGSLRTTLRKELQKFVEEEVQSQIKSLEDKNVHDAAVLVVENSTGNVWAYVGGSGLHLDSKYVDGVQALRQAGSTLKPFLYATAFERHLIHANSWLEDSAVDIVFPGGAYRPLNHDRQFYGWVPARVALASSLNVPAVKVYQLLNDTSFWSKLKQLKFRHLNDAEFYGPSLALGAADVTLEDLTQAYRTLARGGIYSPLHFYPESPSEKPVRIFTQDSVQEVTRILSENQNRSLSFGLDSALAVPSAAVKTGTSKDMRDNWCIGYNSRFTVGVWVGNFNGEPMWNVMGVTGAAPIWRKVLEYLGKNYPSPQELAISKETPAIATKPVLYPQARISYPQDGMVLAIDPSIPKNLQKVPLILEGEKLQEYQWKINGKKIIQAQNVYLWDPQEGKNTFELYRNGELKERLSVVVK